VWGSEFTTKAATLQKALAELESLAEHKIRVPGWLTDCVPACLRACVRALSHYPYDDKCPSSSAAYCADKAGNIFCADKAGNIYSALLFIYRVALLLLRQRRGAASNGLGTTTKYLGRKTSGAAGGGLGTTIKYLRGAAGIGLGTTIKYLRRTTRQRPGHHDQVPAMHIEKTTSSSAALACFSTRPRIASTLPARCSSTSSPA
jgi:hypothetical protein